MKRVYTKLNESPYYFNCDGLVYYFSSFLHNQKYIEKYEANREFVSNNLTKRYKIPVEYNRLADIYLYITIETRGFYVVSSYSREVYEWPGVVKLIGEKKMLKL